LNTGHDGGFASLHAKNAFRSLARLESLAQRGGAEYSADSIRRDIADSIDYIFHLKKHQIRAIDM